METLHLTPVAPVAVAGALSAAWLLAGDPTGLRAMNPWPWRCPPPFRGASERALGRRYRESSATRTCAATILASVAVGKTAA